MQSAVGHHTPTNIMRPIKDYSVGRLIFVAFGVGIVIGALRIAVREVFPSSGWTPFLNGILAGLVIAGTLAYFSTGGRDRQLLTKTRRDT
jgi:hypothetical protein